VQQHSPKAISCAHKVTYCECLKTITVPLRQVKAWL